MRVLMGHEALKARQDRRVDLDETHMGTRMT
jgi:hypothetical protein